MHCPAQHTSLTSCCHPLPPFTLPGASDDHPAWRFRQFDSRRNSPEGLMGKLVGISSYVQEKLNTNDQGGHLAGSCRRVVRRTYPDIPLMSCEAINKCYEMIIKSISNVKKDLWDHQKMMTWQYATCWTRIKRYTDTRLRSIISGNFRCFSGISERVFEATGWFFDGKVGEDSSAVSAGVFLLAFASKVFEATRQFFEIMRNDKK